MIITKYNALTLQQKEEMIALENLSFKKDSLENHAFFSNELNFNKKIPCFYLCHEENELVGFLTIFMPTDQEAEIMAVTHPAYQKKGIFLSLLQEAKEELKKNQVKRILYCVEPKSTQAGTVLKALHISEISHSEYRMTLLRKKISDNLPVKDNIYLKKACQENRNDFAKISREAFGQEEDAVTEKAVTSDDRRGYLLYEGAVPVGVFVLGLEDETFLFGVGMGKDFRGKGYGKYLMQKALEEGFKRDEKIVLDVDSNNPVALQLYKKCGFEVTFQVDYYVESIFA